MTVPLSFRFLSSLLPASLVGFLWACIFAPVGFAQGGGGISGTVNDSGKIPVTGATVRAVNQTTGVGTETKSDIGGAFRIVGLTPGRYTLQTAMGAARVESKFEITEAGQVLDAGAQTLPEDAQIENPAIEPVRQEVTITARRVEEEAQDVPIPVSVVSAATMERAGAFNVNRLKELIPTVQFYSSNPRNSAINIRGLGSPFGLTNDGIEPGVGFYVDGVFYARPAAATLDFLDLQQVEVLRGPQGTLFGKNTTAGAINITTRKPSLTPETNFELSYGNLGFIQAKGSISGPLGKKVAARLSFPELNGTECCTTWLRGMTSTPSTTREYEAR